jgi:hypothetical protein
MYGMEDTATVYAVGTAPIAAPVTLSPLDTGHYFPQDMEAQQSVPMYWGETYDPWV